MCYSKEVSLIAGGIIATGSGYSWWTYIAARARSFRIKKELIPFYRDTVLGIGCIGMHQLFEYLSIATGDQIIYKTGLIFSISCMYFLIRSLEHLTHVRFGSRACAAVIALVAVDIYRRDMAFADEHFYVAGYSHIVWASAWMVLFIYWNLGILYLRTVMTSAVNRRLLLWYGFATLNLSFFISMAYAYAAALVQKTSLFAALFESIGTANIMRSFDVVQDSPSIWCAFASMQAITIPVFLWYANRSYETGARLRIRSVSMVSEAKLVALDACIWFLLFFTLPIFPGVALKMLFK